MRLDDNLKNRNHFFQLLWNSISELGVNFIGLYCDLIKNSCCIIRRKCFKNGINIKHNICFGC